jgi:hypothetical protein
MAKYAGPDERAEASSAGGERFSVLRMTRLPQVSTSGYYAWRKRVAATEPTPRQQRRADLAVKIPDPHTGSDGTYGFPRITSEPRERGKTVNEKPSLRSWPRSGSRASARVRTHSAPLRPTRRRSFRRIWCGGASIRTGSTRSG